MPALNMLLLAQLGIVARCKRKITGPKKVWGPFETFARFASKQRDGGWRERANAPFASELVAVVRKLGPCSVFWIPKRPFFLFGFGKHGIFVAGSIIHSRHFAFSAVGHEFRE